jgi:hypothetical protein
MGQAVSAMTFENASELATKLATTVLAEILSIADCICCSPFFVFVDFEGINSTPAEV